MVRCCTPGMILLILSAVLFSTAQAEEEPDAESQRRLAVIQEAAEMYALYGDDRETKLKRIDKPVLRFDDAVTLSKQGCVYLWIDAQQRPAAIASIYFQADGARIDEFQSLASGAVTAEFSGGVVWQPVGPGITWSKLEDGGEVPDSKSQRLVRMRDLARQFTATVTDRSAGRQELRLLPQPMYRYHDPDNAIVDGAVFSYAKGTNPEILLLVEAVQKDGERHWRHAFCRMTSRDCEVLKEDRVAWKSDPISFPQAADSVYFNRSTR